MILALRKKGNADILIEAQLVPAALLYAASLLGSFPGVLDALSIAYFFT